MIPSDANIYVYEVRGDMDFEPPSPPSSFVGLWNEQGYSYLFFTSPEDQYVNNRICAAHQLPFSCHEMRYEDWQKGLPEEGLHVAGVSFFPVDSRCQPPGAIFLDPSVVFGDGSHPTTLSCLRSIEHIVQTEQVNSLLDLGTGTGILSLAAAAMGIENILAVDNNRLAVETALENVRANSLSSAIQVQLGEAGWFLDEPFDVVVANLPFHVFRDLVQFRGVNIHKWWIASGIYRDQGAILEELFTDQGFRCYRHQHTPPWTTFIAHK
jgi:ribosomal protein L11 methyltransferase